MITIICVGKIKEKYLTEAINEYSKRISKYTKLNIIELPDSNMKEEGNKILNQIKDKDYVIALNIVGKELTSLELANKIEQTFITNPNIVFIIGGSDGLTDEIKEKANFNLSFSKLTFPHQLFRVNLLEQIYRSFKIINNETYHK